jgi:hypothetical protein
MIGRRRFFARLLLTLSLVGATTVHHHSILEDSTSARTSVPLLDSRCALSRTLSLHAISRLGEREVCWACHWNRGFEAGSRAPLPEPIFRTRPLTALPPGAVDHVAAFTRTPRGPPAPLSL